MVPMAILILISHLALTHSQMINSDPSVQAPPTLEGCGPSLLPLAPCGPFVQGQSSEIPSQCCQNIAQVYLDHPGCLCLFLNGTALASLPINATRALQLPGLCAVHIAPSTSCASSSGKSAAVRAPPSNGSFRRNPTTSTAGAPTVTVAPRPSTVRFGMGKSSAYKLAGGKFGVLAAIISLLLATSIW